MARPFLDRDIKPLSEFRANSAAFIQQVQESKRPIVITQHGKSAAVLLDVGEYEALLQRLELLEDVQAGERQIDAGRGLSHLSAHKRVLKKISA